MRTKTIVKCKMNWVMIGFVIFTWHTFSSLTLWTNLLFKLWFFLILHCLWAGLGYSYSVLVLAVLEYWISDTRTREFQIDSIRTCTRTHGQVLRYSYEYWHEYWYSMVHLECKGENHHTCEIDSLTYHKRKVPNWFILLLQYDLNIWYMGCDSKFHRKINWITIMMFMFIVVIRPFSHSTSG